MRRRALALLALLALVGAGCGARLSSKQRGEALLLYRDRSGPAAEFASSTRGGAGPVLGGASTTGGDISAGPAGGAASAASCTGAARGASDVGVSANEIRLGTVSDVTGVVPGIALSTFQGMQAVAAYINSQGGICGRRVTTDLRDDQTTASGNKSATQDACANDFALVGSFSAFDDGGAATVNRMQCPDMSAFTTTAERGAANAYSYPIYPNRPDYFVMASANYLARTHPDVVKNGGIIWLDAGVAAVNARARIDGYSRAGFRFVYQKAAQVLETSYTPFVIDMKQHQPPVKFVTMVADGQSIARLLQAMKQQNWYPEVMQFDLQVYTPDFLELAQGTAEGAMFWLNTAMFEDSAGNPELRLYQEWLQRVDPGAKPDTFGLFAWSAGRLFQQLATKIGPDLTRAKLMAALATVTAWTGHGLHPPMDIAHRLPSGCEVMGVIRNERYVRQYPGTGFDCRDGGVVHLG
ncbi:MAG TPA: ABC transporter substrate-binding protein [Actinomycetota bacterium]|nr:ABC transporter substrate-binding protein [Actinomycetota bacterium]